jgi:murein DD-endopeptidase MepM/ murein hydrolase activator NlpD
MQMWLSRAIILSYAVIAFAVPQSPDGVAQAPDGVAAQLSSDIDPALIFPVMGNSVDEPVQSTQDPRSDGWYVTNGFGSTCLQKRCGNDSTHLYYPGIDLKRFPSPKGDDNHPVFAIGDGVVVRSGPMGGNRGWAVMVQHSLSLQVDVSRYFLTGTQPSTNFTSVITSVYFHLNESKFGRIGTQDDGRAGGAPVAIKRGDVVGTINPALGRLHFELRANSNTSEADPQAHVGGYYASRQNISNFGNIDPFAFIRDHLAEPVSNSGIFRVALDAPRGQLSGLTTGFGWAFECGGALQSLELLVDGVPDGTVLISPTNLPRPDVKKAFVGACPSIAEKTGFTFSFNPNGPSPGAHALRIRATGTDGRIRYSNVVLVKLGEPVAAGNGAVRLALYQPTVEGGKFRIRGWGFRCGGDVASIQLILDGLVVPDATAATMVRDDVAAYFKSSCPVVSRKVGFEFELNQQTLSQAPHQVQVRLFDADGEVHYSTPRMLVGSAEAPLVLAALDGPSGAISGTARGGGWAFRCGGRITNYRLLVDGRVATGASFTLGLARPDVQTYYKSHGCASVELTTGFALSFNANSLATGAHTLRVRVTDDKGQTTDSNVQRITVGGAPAPTPSAGPTLSALDGPSGAISGTARGGGWAFRCGGRITNYTLLVDGNVVTGARFTPGLGRPDVQAYFKSQGCASVGLTTGFALSFSASSLAAGTHTAKVRLTDDAGRITDTNVQRITIANAGAPAPSAGVTLSALDGPLGAISGTASGGGWAFRCGGRITNYTLLVDGKLVTGARVTPGLARPDVQAYFKSRGCASVGLTTGFAVSFSASSLVAGTHMVKVRLTDDTGRITDTNAHRITVANVGAPKK